MVLVLQESKKKKRSKIVIEEFDCCHKFIEPRQYILLLEDRKFVNITYLVSCNEFLIFISYDKKEFGIKIKEFINLIIESDLCRFHWKIHRPLAEEFKNGDWDWVIF